MQGLVHIYTGNGKGKTTSAIGLGIRAYGRGLKVLMVQFLKGTETGEMKTLQKLAPDFQLYQGQKIKKFTWEMNENELLELKEVQEKIFEYAIKETINNQWDLLILDEIMGAISMNLIPLENVLQFIQSKPLHLEVVLTGRNAPARLVDLADYVSDITCVKHPMEKGVPARKGIEV
ncbi:MAG: cob(I)yrinic acid a,c-diamide adenosyltransferase [Clostridia bacterium]|nr:cob(I)yrinic acid a,c-diamide adenosyltransferase [Clostridia bacterium]